MTMKASLRRLGSPLVWLSVHDRRKAQNLRAFAVANGVTGAVYLSPESKHDAMGMYTSLYFETEGTVIPRVVPDCGCGFSLAVMKKQTAENIAWDAAMDTLMAYCGLYARPRHQLARQTTLQDALRGDCFAHLPLKEFLACLDDETRQKMYLCVEAVYGAGVGHFIEVRKAARSQSGSLSDGDLVFIVHSGAPALYYILCRFLDRHQESHGAGNDLYLAAAAFCAYFARNSRLAALDLLSQALGAPLAPLSDVYHSLICSSGGSIRHFRGIQVLNDPSNQFHTPEKLLLLAGGRDSDSFLVRQAHPWQDTKRNLIGHGTPEAFTHPWAVPQMPPGAKPALCDTVKKPTDAGRIQGALHRQMGYYQRRGVLAREAELAPFINIQMGDAVY